MFLRRISITDCLCVVVYVSVNGCVKYGGYSNNSIFRRQCHLYLDFLKLLFKVLIGFKELWEFFVEQMGVTCGTAL